MHIGILLSGGVDSSVVLAMLAEKGEHQLTAYYLKIWLEDELSFLGDCPWEEDLKYARAVCEKYGVPLEIIPLQTEYHNRVVDYTLKELKKGFTPSPDIFCNQMIKFGAFWERVSDKVDAVASGHYATVVEEGGDYFVQQGVDPVKDQSYFLSHLSQEQLSRCFFPLGEFSKEEVRELAQKYDLPTKDRPDSQGICFLGKIKYKEFVDFHLGQKVGPIIDEESMKEIGNHQGYWYHTVGQRKGLGLGGGPWFVTRKDVDHNTVFVRHADRNSKMSSKTFYASEPHWFASAPEEDVSYEVKLRHGPRKIPAQVKQTEAGFKVELAQEDQGISCGQFAVFYKGQKCLGAAKISEQIVAN